MLHVVGHRESPRTSGISASNKESAQLMYGDGTRSPLASEVHQHTNNAPAQNKCSYFVGRLYLEKVG